VVVLLLLEALLLVLLLVKLLLVSLWLQSVGGADRQAGEEPACAVGAAVSETCTAVLHRQKGLCSSSSWAVICCCSCCLKSHRRACRGWQLL
jgi:hypothetical protein